MKQKELPVTVMGFSISCEELRRPSIDGPIRLISRLFSKREPLPCSSTPPVPLLVNTQLRIVTLSALNDAMGPSMFGMRPMAAPSFSGYWLRPAESEHSPSRIRTEGALVTVIRLFSCGYSLHAHVS